MIDSLLKKLANIAEIEFADIVIGYEIIEGKLRLYIVDESFLDVWFSRQIEGRYAYHWERRHLDETIYRWDNARHEAWKNVSTFPHHFHNRVDDDVSENFLSKEPSEAIKFILEFIRDIKAEYINKLK
jgi:hypothetical protein